MFGTAGLPTLMRFYTVPDAKTAQFGHLRDGFHWLLLPAHLHPRLRAMVFVGQDDIKRIDPGGSMAAPCCQKYIECLLGLHRCGFLRHYPGGCSWANALWSSSFVP